MKFVPFFFYFIFIHIQLNGQNNKSFYDELILDVLNSVDPHKKLEDLKSIYYEGFLFNHDTFKIEFNKLLPDNFKSITYNQVDSVVSIVNEFGYYQFRNDQSLYSEKFREDQAIFFDLTKFNLFYALSTTYKEAEMRMLADKDTTWTIDYLFNTGHLYTFTIDKRTKRIIEYSCECIKINKQSGYIKLKHYKEFEGLFLPSIIELWTDKKLIEIFKYESISFNNLNEMTFSIPNN